LREAFSGLIARGTKVALVDFTETSNAGNHAIWLGEKRLLAELGATIVYECSAQSYDRAAMAEKLGQGTILLHGGAHAGGRDAAHRGFRWRVVADFPEHSIIGMPYQPAREDEEPMRQAAETIRAHTALVLFAASDAARQSFSRVLGPSIRVELAPDPCLMLPPRHRLAEIGYDLVWIARTDGDLANDQTETAARLSSQAAEKFTISGFTDGMEISYVAKHRPQTILLTDWQAFVYENDFARMAIRRLSFDAWAEVYAGRGFHVLSLGQVVITDRLHGHLMAMLLNLPHLLLNDGSGRNWSYYETWTKNNARCRLAHNPAEAWSLARQAAARLKEMPAAEAAQWTWADLPANPG
jgi:pyruvyl transferase EpsO